MKFIVPLLLLFLFIFSSGSVQAQTFSSQHYKAKVTEVTKETQITSEGNEPTYTQELHLFIPSLKRNVTTVIGSEYQPLTSNQRLKKGTQVVVVQQTLPDGSESWSVTDVYRLPVLAFLAVGFCVLVIMISRWRGLAALAGMLLSGVILLGFIVPQILAGGNPLLISLVGAIGITVSTVYLSHGFNPKSHIAVVSLIITLLAVTFLAQMSVSAAQLLGLGSEEAAFLRVGETSWINLQGLLLGGIILGALGVLDDVIISQISVVQQLVAVNKKLEVDELYNRSLEVGKDHVASLVNTLVLAYAGANLPLFLLFHLNQNVPTWVVLNDQVIAEEVVRTLVGSIGLVLAVPFASLIAAIIFKRFSLEIKEDTSHTHVH